MSTPPPTGDKAAAELAEARAKAERAAHEAASAKVKLEKEQREEREAAAEEAQQKRTAELRKATAEADKAAAAALRDQVGMLIPDFKDVERGKLEVKGDKPMFAPALAHRAVERAAAKIGDDVHGLLQGKGRWRLLITSDSDLIGSDGTYVNVKAALRQLQGVATEVLEGAVRKPGPAPLSPGVRFITPVIPAAVSALAQAAPAVLGVLSAQRTVTSSETTADDLAASAAVAGALHDEEGAGTIVHDDLRLLPEGAVHRTHGELVALRQRLAALKLALEDEKAAKKDDEQALASIRPRLAMVDSVSQAIDTFAAFVVAVPAGSKRSPLQVAASREQLHAGVDGQFTHVLLVRSQGGSVHQTVDDKPFFAEDRVSIVGAASVTYLLMETATSALLHGGTAAGVATAHGKIGNRFELGGDLAT